MTTRTNAAEKTSALEQEQRNQQPGVRRLRVFYGQRYRLGRKRYRVTATDLWTVHVVGSLTAEASAAHGRCWLLKHRQAIRHLKQLQPRAILTLVAIACNDPTARQIAIWLRGLCGGYLGSKHLFNCIRQAPPQTSTPESTRKTLQIASKALFRMSAWAELRQLKKLYGDVSPFVDLAARQDFDKRMSRFMTNVSPRPVQLDKYDRSGDATAGIDETVLSNGRPAKPVWLIRLVLDRIRLLVSSEQSTDRIPTGL